MKQHLIPNLELLEETALAMAQSTIQNAMDNSELSRADIAVRMGRPKSFVSKILSGSHNLTVRTLARALGACGAEVFFQRAPVCFTVCSWDTSSLLATPEPNNEEVVVATEGRHDTYLLPAAA